MMNRRDMLLSMAGALSMCARGAQAQTRTQLGVVIYCFGIRQRAERSRDGGRDLFDPLEFLEHCHRVGAGGIQVPLGTKDETYISGLCQKAEAYEMFIEGIAPLPRDPADVERFETQVRTAKRAGVKVIRVVMIPGRRYERFDSAEEFRRFAELGLKSLELAEPVAARHHIRLALENHKDQRIAERLDVLKRLSSEYIGTCVDVGNSFSLLEDPIEVVETYAPWAFSVHLKDQAVREYEDGFLFADAPLGEGFLDLPRMVRTLRKKRPEVRFSLEVITRDPLKVPCLTEKYWATFAEVPGRDLARTLRTVRANVSKAPLPRISHLSPDEQIEREEENVKRSLIYARDHLGL